MGRILSLNFGLNSLTAGVEVDLCDAPIGDPGLSIQGTIKRSGNYALKYKANGSTVASQLCKRNITTIVSGRTYFCRTYIYIVTLPESTKYANFLNLTDSALVHGLNCALQPDGTVSIWDADLGSMGATTATLGTGSWIRVELSYVNSTGAIELEFDGTTVLTNTASSGIGMSLISVGAGGNNTQGEWYFADIAVNDDQGSYQNSWPGDSKIIYLRPNAAGESTQWTPSAGNNYACVNEIPPDEHTSYVGVTTLNYLDMYGMDSPGLGAGDVINVVEVGGRFARSASASPGFKFRLIKTSGGTELLSAEITPITNQPTYKTNVPTGAMTSPIIAHRDPDGSAWTNTTIDSLQAGMKEVTDTNRTLYITALWVIVDYTPAGGPTLKSLAGSFQPGAGIISRLPKKTLTGALRPSLTGVKKVNTSKTGSLLSSGALTTSKVFTKIMTAVLSFIGVAAKKTGKGLTAVLAPIGVLSRAVRKVLSSILSYTGTLATQKMGAILKALDAGISFTGVVTKRTAHSFIAVLTSSGDLLRSVFKTVAAVGVFTSSGTLFKAVGRRLSGTLSPAGSVVRKIARILAGTLSSIGTLATLKLNLFFKPLSAGISFTGVTVKRTIRLLSAALTSIGTLLESTFKAVVLSGVLAPSGTVVKKTVKSLTSALTTIGSLLAQAAGKTLKTLDASMAFTGALVKQTTHSFAGVLTATGLLLKKAVRPLAGTLSSTGRLVKVVSHRLFGILTSSGALIRRATIGKVLAGVLTTVGAVTKRTIRPLSGILAPTVVLLKRTAHSFAGVLAPTGKLVKGVARQLTGTLAFTGVFSRRVGKVVAGTLTSIGSLSRKIGKVAAGVMSWVGILVTQKISGVILKSLAGVLTSSGRVVKSIQRSLAGTLLSSAALATQKIAGLIIKSLSAGIAFTGQTTKRVSVSLIGMLGLAGQLAVRTAGAIILTATLSFTGTLPRPVFSKVLQAVTSFTGVCGKAIKHILPTNLLSFVGELFRVKGAVKYKDLVGRISFTAISVKRTGKKLDSVLQLVGSIVRGTTTYQRLAAALSFIGDLFRFPKKNLQATMSLSGGLSFESDLTRHMTVVAISTRRHIEAVPVVEPGHGQVAVAGEGYRDKTAGEVN